MSAGTRRSTRRTAASTEVAQSAPMQSTQQDSTARSVPKKKAPRKTKTSGPVESQTVTESQQTVTNHATSRANVTPATTTITSIVSTTTTQTPVPSRTTRNRKKADAANGVASPLRSLDDKLQQVQPEKPGPKKRQGRGTARQKNTNEQSKPVQAESSADDENEEEPLFFSMSKNNISSSSVDTEYPILRKENNDLRARITELESSNARLNDLVQNKDHEIERLERISAELAHQLRLKAYAEPASSPFPSPSQQFSDRLLITSSPLRTSQVFANYQYSDFDDNLMLESAPAEPEFINGSESALALLHKIENAAKGPVRVHSSSINDSEAISDNNVTMANSPQQSTKRTFTEVSATPERPVAKAPSFLSRSFSAITSRFFSTPKAPSTLTPDAIATAPPKPLPAQDTFTETLSIPPTPIGERVQTPSKRRAPVDRMMKVLLKGVECGEKQKAEAWAKQVIPELKNDPAFREKRKRLEATVLFKDLTYFPSAKPWEAGFGDPLGDLDDDDAVPGWAIYLNMKAEEEEHQAKKHKRTHRVNGDNDEVPSINEQFAASNSARTSPKLYNSHGQSASLYDFHPRRSIDPSPMFTTSVSHNEGGNIFSELQGHDNAAQIREGDREVFNSATKDTLHTHDPGMGSFSVPDESDEEDPSMENVTSDTEATPLWTQPPPPAPVPAHAPLPDGPVADSSAVPTTQQPENEIERQRQRLMKHTPAKPSRLREATYPSPSLLSEAGTNSPLFTTAQITGDFASMYSDIPAAPLIELDEEEQAAFDEIVSTDEYKKLLTANDWPAPIISYESDEEGLSPISA